MNIKQSLRILHLTDGNRGGSQRHIIDLCRGDTPGVHHFVLRVAAESISIHDAARDRVLVIDPPSAPEELAAILRTVIAELAIGCVHAHALPVLLAAAESAARPLGTTPVLVTLHDLGCIDPHLFTAPSPEPRPDPGWIARCAPPLRGARAVIVPSDYLARQVRIYYPDTAPLVIPNGIAAAPNEALPVTPPWPENARVFAVVGALGLHKGSDTLLRVARALKEPDIVGIVIGYTDAQLTPGWIVPGRLYVHGRYYPDELPGLLKSYRVRLAYFPNIIPESFGYALSEVWQAGVPALAPAIGALGDRVRAAGAGWLLDNPLDADAAAAAIERLLGPDRTSALAAARAKLEPPSSSVPGMTAMRAVVARAYRTHTAPLHGDTDSGWARLRTLLRPRLLSSTDDCALDAEWPALVREEHTLRDWNGKLTRDVATLEATARRVQEQLAECPVRSRQLEGEVQLLKSRNEQIESDAAVLIERNLGLERDNLAQKARNLELENNVVALKQRNVHIEADAVALDRRNVQIEGDIVTLTQRNIELHTDIVALKERNTLVEADLFALKQRNTLVEQDAAALQTELAATRERIARIEHELASERERASRLEWALAKLPSIIQHWLLRHAR